MSKAETNPAPASFSSLPIELKIKIFNYDDFVSRVCLAVTSKTFYETYETAYGKMKDQPVSLRERNIFFEDGRLCKMHLGTLLASWASRERALWYWPDGNKWMTIQQWARVVKLCRRAGISRGVIYRTVDRV
ncbi:hypothetical protein N431DRAFT_458606 [Stipitochalara longipes BDJ]|nr:hypothetical protein N431DRAFT_458606 [Stipitochalara longipes BDJ]